MQHLNQSDYVATIRILDGLLAGRSDGYAKTEHGREIDWDLAGSKLSSTERAILDAVKALHRLEWTGPPAEHLAGDFKRYVEQLLA